MPKVNVARRVEQSLNKLGTLTDGVCDVCTLPVDQHPCPEHQQAVIEAQMQTVIDTQDELWAPFLDVDTMQPQAGQF